MKRIVALAAVSLAALGLAGGAAAQDVPPRRVALVVGVSSYEKLPAALALDTPRTDAARVAAALEQDAGFDRVRLLTDASATRANLVSVLEGQVGAEVGPNDLFLLYFVGHGMGADFGDPRLLVYDTDPDALEETSIGVRDLAAKLQASIHPARWVVMTDAAFEGQFDGVALLGPTGNDWPALGPHSFVISSAAPRQTARPGVFARAVIDGLGGGADSNEDGQVTASELNGWLVTTVPEATGGKQSPTVQGTYDPSVVIGVARRQVVELAPVQTVEITPVARLDKVKFVVHGGAAPTVQCPDAAPLVCDPSCYVWDVSPGACRVTARVGGADVDAVVDVRQRGAYTCTAVGAALQCGPAAP